MHRTIAARVFMKRIKQENERTGRSKSADEPAATFASLRCPTSAAKSASAALGSHFEIQRQLLTEPEEKQTERTSPKR